LEGPDRAGRAKEGSSDRFGKIRRCVSVVRPANEKNNKKWRCWIGKSRACSDMPGVSGASTDSGGGSAGSASAREERGTGPSKTRSPSWFSPRPRSPGAPGGAGRIDSPKDPQADKMAVRALIVLVASGKRGQAPGPRGDLPGIEGREPVAFFLRRASSDRSVLSPQWGFEGAVLVRVACPRRAAGSLLRGDGAAGDWSP
jgi:hypothetical protein